MELRPALMPGCILLPYDTAAGHCRACGEKLGKGKRSWCAAECQKVYERNHYWNYARDAAVKRDKYRCVKCGWSPEFYDQLANGQYIFWSRTWLLKHGNTNWLEVNHITPRGGAGYGTGCWNHLAGLETLCHKCHVKVTHRQRIARARAKTG